MKRPNQYVWLIKKKGEKKECHYDVVFELFCLSMRLMTLDNNNNKKNKNKKTSSVKNYLTNRT